MSCEQDPLTTQLYALHEDARMGGDSYGDGDIESDVVKLRQSLLIDVFNDDHRAPAEEYVYENECDDDGNDLY